MTNRYYHLVSRIAHRAFFLTEDERTRFVDRLWRVAQFSGIDVLAYCFMSNHFHILIYVPEPSELSDADLLSRIKALYTGIRLEEILKEWKLLSTTGGDENRQAFRQKFLRRMWNVSEFMKTLKQNATMSYNSRLVHSGTMWEARFRAQAYDPDEKVALMNVAGYIDRNPVKAKIASWPARSVRLVRICRSMQRRHALHGRLSIHLLLRSALMGANPRKARKDNPTGNPVAGGRELRRQGKNGTIS